RRSLIGLCHSEFPGKHFVDECRLLFKPSRLHRLKLHPFDRLGAKLSRSPLMGAVKDSQLVSHAHRIKSPSELHHLGIVEIRVANGREHDERGRTSGNDVCWETRSARYNACDLSLQRISKLEGDARAAGKPRGVDASIIYVESDMRVLPHSVDGG